MTQYELTKMAGAVLAALLLIFGTKTFVEIRLAGHGHGHGKFAGYKLPAADAATGGTAAVAGAAPAEAGYSFAKVAEALPKANVENGKDIFKKCTSCHSIEKGGKALQGPNLWGVVGRPKGAVQGFGYSEPMKAKGGDWSYESLANFVNNPKGYIAGTKMVFSGLSAPSDIADLLAYMRTMADTPAAAAHHGPPRPVSEGNASTGSAPFAPSSSRTAMAAGAPRVR